jgi:hypothetical protein
MSGAGRGRGWLNLPKSAEPPRPTGLHKPTVNNTSPVPQINSPYKELIDRMKEINLNDDGIMFNKKMKYVQEYWLQECGNEEEVKVSFEHLYNGCLHDADLASKLVALVAARSFTTQEIHNCSLRHQFLTNLQRDFENSNQLQTTSPLMFRNCVHMIGEFYSKAKLANGEPFNFLAVPFLSCLELLLNSKSLPDLVLFTNQLFLNGVALRSTAPDELSKLGIKIRMLLVIEPQLVKDAKLWLLLALDLFSVRFGVLPTEIYKYYEDQLGSIAMSSFPKPHDALSIQTVHSSKILDSYQSNVNVLQISTSPSETTQNDIQGSQFTNVPEYNNIQQNSGFVKDVPAKSKEKTGRPILGAGARFIKKGNEENGTWSNKQNSGSGRPHHNKKSPSSHKNNKGWEHDDRFENDYN